MALLDLVERQAFELTEVQLAELRDDLGLDPDEIRERPGRLDGTGPRARVEGGGLRRREPLPVELIGQIVDRQAQEQNDEGDKFLSDAYLALEAIAAVLNGVSPVNNGALRMFLEATP
jgi:hypothetical protein